MSPTHKPFRSILVPVDGSALAEQAIPLALAIAERAGSQVRLVLVHREVSPLRWMEPAQQYTGALLAVERSESDYLKALTGRLGTPPGTTLTSAALKGPVVSTLARYIREVGVDLVVMTTHGRGGIRRAWLGSVTDELIRTVNVPIIVVRAQPSAALTGTVNVPEILVPLDGSPLAEAALGPVAALAGFFDAKISLVNVVQPVLLVPDHTVPSGYDERLTSIQRDTARDYLRDLAEGLREQGLSASGVAVLGAGTADTILDLARPERVGMIALATHGRGSLRRLTLGSVADKLVRAADVPVLVVRPTERRAKRTPHTHPAEEASHAG